MHLTIYQSTPLASTKRPVSPHVLETNAQRLKKEEPRDQAYDPNSN